MRIAVVGAGAMGRWAVKELDLCPDVAEVVVGHCNEERTCDVASQFGGGKGTGYFVDARDQESVRRAVDGCAAMVNAVCGNVDDTDWSGYEGWVMPYSLETLATPG